MLPFHEPVENVLRYKIDCLLYLHLLCPLLHSLIFSISVYNSLFNLCMFDRVRKNTTMHETFDGQKNKKWKLFVEINFILIFLIKNFHF